MLAALSRVAWTHLRVHRFGLTLSEIHRCLYLRQVDLGS